MSNRVVDYTGEKWERIEPASTMFNVSTPYAYYVARFYLLVEGLIGSLFYYGALPLFLFHFKTDNVQYQKYVAMASVMWNAKPVYAVMSDLYPIRGRHKYYYALVPLCLIPIPLIGATVSSTQQLMAGFFVVFFTLISMAGTMFDGQYALRIRLKQEPAKLVPYVYLCIAMGSLIGVIIVGVSVMSNPYHITYAFALAMPLVLPILYAMVKDPDTVFDNDRPMVQEELHAPIHQNNDVRPITLRQAPTTSECILTVSMFLTGLFLLFLLNNTRPGAGVVAFCFALVFCGFVLTFMSYVYRSLPRLKRVCLFAFFYEALYGNIMGSMDLFYTAPDACILNGPHFDMLFYITWTKIISNIITLIAARYLYAQNMQFSCRTIICTGITIRIFSAATDIIIAKRWNVDYISDKVIYIFGDAVLYYVGMTIGNLGLITAATRELIVGRENTTLAIIAGARCLGISMSQILGIFLTEAYGVTGDLVTNQCNYDNYVPLIVLAHCVLTSFLYPMAMTLPT